MSLGLVPINVVIPVHLAQCCGTFNKWVCMKLKKEGHQRTKFVILHLTHPEVKDTEREGNEHSGPWRVESMWDRYSSSGFPVPPRNSSSWLPTSQSIYSSKQHCGKLFHF